MEDVVEKMRRDVEIQIMGDTFRVAYVSQDPKQAMDVAGRLTSLLVDASLRDREALVSATSDFLQGQLDLTRRDFAENAQKMERARIEKNTVTVRVLTLEAEVLEATYKALLAKAQEAKLAVSLNVGSWANSSESSRRRACRKSLCVRPGWV